MSEHPLLAAKAISKRVRDGQTKRVLFEDVHLELGPAEMVVVSGESGAGKTTLLGVLGGMLLPSSGEVWIRGELVSRLREHHRAETRRKQVGYVFQDMALLPGINSLENLLLPLLPTGVPTAADHQRALGLLKSFGLADRAHTFVDRLSGGEKQRVALARALMNDPPLLLLDEPTSHLDAASASQLLARLVEFREQGKSLVIVSHDPRILQADLNQTHLRLSQRGLSPC